MTKFGSFKRLARQRAQRSGKRYTQVLAELESDAVTARVVAATRWKEREHLVAHLESRYRIKVRSLAQLSPHGAGVFRVDRTDGPPWVARLIPLESRSLERLQEDAELLGFLETADYPAERCAVPEPVSTLGAEGVVVTAFVQGSTPIPLEPPHVRALGELLGQLHALPNGLTAIKREGGAFVHDPDREGRPSQNLVACTAFLDEVAARVPEEGRRSLTSLREEVETADGCDDLPEALTNPDMADRNVILTPSGGLVAVDWKGSGRGARLPAFAHLLMLAGRQSHVKEAPTVHGGDSGLIQAAVVGYRTHVQLTPRELDRLTGAMRIGALYVACWYYWTSVRAGNIPTASEGWWPDHSHTDAIAEKAVKIWRDS